MREIRGVIDRLAIGGRGVCRIEGKVCFVPGGCPGDELLLEVTAEKRSYIEARIVDLLHPSLHRVEPVCPLFGNCGGCDWQHIEYSCQLSEKRRMFVDALWRGGRVEQESVGTTIAAPSSYGYRSRVQFKLHWDGCRLHMGFFRTGSHYVVDTPGGCPVALPAINEAAQQLRGLLEGFFGRDRVPQVNLEYGDQGVCAIINYIGGDMTAAREFFTAARRSLPSVSGLWLQSGRKSTLDMLWGTDVLSYSLPSWGGGECLFDFTPGGFSQVNMEQNRALMKVIMGMVNQNAGHLLDLYCGNGNFSLPLAGAYTTVTGVESYEGSIFSARSNANRNKIENAAFICSETSEALEMLLDDERRFEVVLLDPPRAGAADAVAGICRLHPEAVVYISCDPSTLARDCGLMAACGYRVVESFPVDMFPQTAHLESVTLFKRS